MELLKKSLGTSALTGLLMLSSQASASLCNTLAGLGETALEGSTVCFIYNPADIDPIFGTLNSSGDNIFVLPTNFEASSTNGTPGVVEVTGTGSIQVIAKPGFVLDGINVGETGDYRLNGPGTSVDVTAYLRVFDWFDPAPIFGTEETTFLTVTDPLNIQDNVFHTWNANGGFDLTTPLWDNRDHVGLTLQNTLQAISSANGESAFIQKKAIGSEIVVSIDTSPIPVPAAVWLFASGLLGLVGIARRRHS